jgi:hypothetical protein
LRLYWRQDAQIDGGEVDDVGRHPVAPVGERERLSARRRHVLIEHLRGGDSEELGHSGRLGSLELVTRGEAAKAFEHIVDSERRRVDHKSRDFVEQLPVHRNDRAPAQVFGPGFGPIGGAIRDWRKQCHA